MGTVQLATRIDQSQEQLFRDTTRRLGTTPADAVRIFIAAFNQHQGFPFDVRLSTPIEPLTTEAQAVEFVDRQAMRMLDETR